MEPTMMKSRPIDTNKMFIIPLIIIFLTMILVGYLTFTFTARRFKDNMIENGTILAETMAHSIDDNLTYKENFIGLLDQKMLEVGYYIIDYRASLSDAYLASVMASFDLTNAYWYSPTGEVLYDASGDFIGWQAQPGDPIHDFMISGLDYYVEDIRKSTEDDLHYKFVYIRDTDGSFIQVGINAEIIYEITYHYEYQSIIEHFVEKNPELLYALVINTNYISVADTDTNEIGVDYSGDEAYALALSGTTNGDDWYYSELGETVLEVATPIYHNGDIIGILGVGYSYSNYYEIRNFLINIFFLLILSILTIYTFVQYRGVIKPLSKFSTDVENLDLNKVVYLEPVFKKSTISGLQVVFTELVNKIILKDEENKAIIARTSNLAFIDQLTGLPNRNACTEKLDDLCKSGEQTAVIYLDVDDFKSVNDTKGHYYGDMLIQNIANRLKSIEDENLYVSRHQGDEFLLLYTFTDYNKLDDIIESIKEQFKLPVEIEDSILYVEFSMGIAITKKDGNTSEVLLQKADIAMYEAKKKDKMSHVFFDEHMGEVLSRKNIILSTLNQAIIHDGFYLLYQPQVNIETNEIIGLEALLRLKDSNISPYEFIPIAETNRLINKIGRIVIEKVIIQQADWIKSGIEVPVYVNFSANQFQDNTILDFIEETLINHQVPPTLFGLEVTESTIISNRALTIKMLERLKSIGVKTAIDDFGSGQAGINYMTNFKVDMVKFDKSFSDKYLTKETIDIYHTILKLTHDLGFITLAEGIETQTQVDLLKKTDCYLVQGYFFYKPMHGEALFEILRRIV